MSRNKSTTLVVNDSHGFDGFINPLTSDYAYNVVLNRIYGFDPLLLTKTDITSSLAMSTTPAGLKDFSDAKALVISATGEIDISLDGGANYSAHSSNSALTSCGSRFLTTKLSDNLNVIATGCVNGNKVSYTLNGGATWKDIGLVSYPSVSSCVIGDISILNNRLFVACQNVDLFSIKMD